MKLPSGSGPRAQAPRSVAIPELKALREMRSALASRGMPTAERRTPEDHARFLSFHVLAALLRLLERYRHRVENGEPCRIVQREHPFDMNRLIIEFEIDVQP